MPRDLIRNAYQLRALLEELLPLDGRGEVYTFVPDTSGPNDPAFLYLVPLARQWAEKNLETITVLANPEQAVRICNARGIKPDEAFRVTDTREPHREDPPALLAHWTDSDTHVMFDGNHRMVAHGLRGECLRPAYVFKQKFLLQMGFCAQISRKLSAEIGFA